MNSIKLIKKIIKKKVSKLMIVFRWSLSLVGSIKLSCQLDKFSSSSI
jgi:hypothetical protein